MAGVFVSIGRKEPDVRKSRDRKNRAFWIYTGKSYTPVDHYISSLTQFAYFLSLFELVSLLSKQFNLSRHSFAATCVCLTRYSYAGAGYIYFTHYPIYNFSIYLLFLSFHSIGLYSAVDTSMDFVPILPGLEFIFIYVFFFAILLQFKFNITVSTQILILYYPLYRPAAPSALCYISSIFT